MASRSVVFSTELSDDERFFVTGPRSGKRMKAAIIEEIFTLDHDGEAWGVRVWSPPEERTGGDLEFVYFDMPGFEPPAEVAQYLFGPERLWEMYSV